MSLLTELKNVNLLSYVHDIRFIDYTAEDKKFVFKVNDYTDETDVTDEDDKTIMQAKFDTIEKG